MAHGILHVAKHGIIHSIKHSDLTLGINLTGVKMGGLAGQSNGSGFAKDTDIMNEDRTLYAAPYSNVYMWERMTDGITDPPNFTRVRNAVPLSPRPLDINGGTFGQELSCMRVMDHAVPRGFAIAKFCLPSASLAVNFQPVGSTYPTVPPRLVDQMITYWRNIELATGAVMSWIDWDQGENDCATPAFAAAYQTNLENLIDKTRLTWPNIPWIIRRLHTGAGGSDNTTVRTAQAAVAISRPFVTVVDVDPLNITTLHFTANQYVSAGKLIAKAALAALSIPCPPFAEFRYFGSSLSVQFTDMSTDIDGTIASWDWDWGDGTAHGTTQNPTHAYAAPGTYSVRLTATDNSGRTDSITHSVVVANNAWAIDATSGKAVPNTGAELTAFLAACGITASGTALWRLQEASGVAADSIGTVTLTPNNSPTYAQAVAGWTRVGIKFTDGTNNQRLLNSTTAPNPALTPCLLLAYVSLPATPAAARDILGLVGNADVRFNSTGKLRLVSGASADLVNSPSSTVQPIILRTTPAGEIALYTEQERFYGTSVTPTSATQVFLAGQTAPASASTYLYALELSGAAAQRTDDEIRTILRTAGWNPTW